MNRPNAQEPAHRTWQCILCGRGIAERGRSPVHLWAEFPATSKHSEFEQRLACHFTCLKRAVHPESRWLIGGF